MNVISKSIVFISLILFFICMVLINKSIKKERTKDMDLDIKLLQAMLNNIPHVTTHILEKSYKTGNIKLSIAIGAEGVADALLGNSPVDKVKKQIEEYPKFGLLAKKPYNIEIFIK